MPKSYRVPTWAKVLTILAGASLALNGCISFDPPEPSANFPAQISPTVAAKALPGGALKEDVKFNDIGDLEDALENVSKVSVPGLILIVQTETGAKAKVQGGRTLGGGQSSGASSEIKVRVTNLTAADLRQIADQVYADLLAQLASTGREVVSADEVKGTKGFHGIDFAEINEGGSHFEEPSMTDPSGFVILSPTGLPLWYPMGLSAGAHSVGKISMVNGRAFHWVAFETKSAAILPIIQVTLI